jgi:hypothetical protein
MGPHRYDRPFTGEVLPAIRELGLIPIIDHCHFGVPGWAGDFQIRLAGPMRAFAARQRLRHGQHGGSSR